MGNSKKEYSSIWEIHGTVEMLLSWLQVSEMNMPHTSKPGMCPQITFWLKCIIVVQCGNCVTLFNFFVLLLCSRHCFEAPEMEVLEMTAVQFSVFDDMSLACWIGSYIFRRYHSSSKIISSHPTAPWSSGNPSLKWFSSC
jgi:hypothetical protein